MKMNPQNVALNREVVKGFETFCKIDFNYFCVSFIPTLVIGSWLLFDWNYIFIERFCW